jgi:hypothetical protein
MFPKCERYRDLAVTVHHFLKGREEKSRERLNRAISHTSHNISSATLRAFYGSIKPFSAGTSANSLIDRMVSDIEENDVLLAGGQKFK